MTPHFHMKYVDHCGSCRAVIVTFQRASSRRLFSGCDCPPDCEHPHRAAVYDMAYAVNIKTDDSVPYRGVKE